MENQNYDDLLFDQSSEGESSSSSNPYESQPFILDLHEITKENASAENAKRIRKTKKKKKNRSQASVSSESTTNSAVPVPAVVEELPREEFYDAHESYHALPANQIANHVAPENQVSNPVAAVALAQAHSEHAQDPKLVDPKAVDPSAPDTKVQEAAPTQGQTLEAQKQPSAITKPVTGPE